MSYIRYVNLRLINLCLKLKHPRKAEKGRYFLKILKEHNSYSTSTTYWFSGPILLITRRFRHKTSCIEEGVFNLLISYGFRVRVPSFVQFNVVFGGAHYFYTLLVAADGCCCFKTYEIINSAENINETNNIKFTLLPSYLVHNKMINAVSITHCLSIDLPSYISIIISLKNITSHTKSRRAVTLWLYHWRQY